jgi:CheY-like chemotaxis protein
VQPSLELEGLHLLQKHSTTSRRLHLVVVNNSRQVLKMLCDWFKQHGHHCNALLLSDIAQAQVEVGEFVSVHRPDVVVYDVGMPYASSWDLLDVIRMPASLRSQAFVITTPNKAKLELAVGATSAIEIGGGERDLRTVLKAVEAAAGAAAKHT